jgi:hypothetical protein
MWFDRAATLPETESDARAALSLDAAANHLCAGDFARARSIYERVTTTSDPLVRLQAAIGMEEANARPGVATTRGADLLSSAIAACGLDQADARYVRALGSMGRALAFAGRTREARAVGHRAIEIAAVHRRVGSPAHPQDQPVARAHPRTWRRPSSSAPPSSPGCPSRRASGRPCA